MANNWKLPTDGSERHDVTVDIYDRFTTARRDAKTLEAAIIQTLDMLQEELEGWNAVLSCLSTVEEELHVTVLRKYAQEHIDKLTAHLKQWSK